MQMSQQTRQATAALEQMSQPLLAVQHYFTVRAVAVALVQVQAARQAVQRAETAVRQARKVLTPQALTTVAVAVAGRQHRAAPGQTASST